MRGLSDKVAVVAGGAGGIGTASSLRLAEEGAAVVVGDLDGDAARGVAARINDAGGRAVDLAFDIADEDLGARASSTSPCRRTTAGSICLHCNAAALDPDIIGRDSDVETVPLDVFDRTIAVNLRGHFLCTRLAIPHLSRRGGGAIVYTASAAAYIGEPERPSYAIAKSGLTALARHVASRWGKEGIRAERDRARPDHDARGRRRDDGGSRARRRCRAPGSGLPEDIAAARRVPAVRRRASGSTARSSASTAAARCGSNSRTGVTLTAS